MAHKYVIIKQGLNTNNVKYAIFRDITDDTYGVWSVKQHYSGAVRGGLRSEWVYIKQGITLEDALKIYQKRLKGKARN